MVCRCSTQRLLHGYRSPLKRTMDFAPECHLPHESQKPNLIPHTHTPHPNPDPNRNPNRNPNPKPDPGANPMRGLGKGTIACRRVTLNLTLTIIPHRHLTLSSHPDRRFTAVSSSDTGKPLSLTHAHTHTHTHYARMRRPVGVETTPTNSM